MTTKEEWLAKIEAAGGRNLETEEIIRVKWISTLPGGAEDPVKAEEAIERNGIKMGEFKERLVEDGWQVETGQYNCGGPPGDCVFSIEAKRGIK